MLFLKKLLRNKKTSFTDFFAVLLFALFSLAGVLVSVSRYWQYEIFFYDFGIFDQAIWSVARFSPPLIDHMVVGGKWIFADHFNPSIFILSPLYWITDKSEVLLIAQAVVVGLSGLVLYFIGREILKNRFLSLSVMFSYLFFTGLQNAVITDFHEVTIATLPLMLAFLMVVKKNVKLFFLFLLLTLGFKESNFLVGIGIGVAIFFIRKEWRKVAFATCIISLMWGIISIKYIIPYFSGGFYQYSEPVSLNPINIISTFINHPIKLNTMFHTFISFGFLPALSPAFWFLIFQDFFARFYSSLGISRATLGFHYSSLISVIMAVSSIYSLNMLQKKFSGNLIRFIAVILILNSLFLYRFILRGPFAMAYNPALYRHTADFKFLDDLVKKVPKDSSVAAQNNLAVRFTHQKSWLLRTEAVTMNNPDYIVMDVRPKQNINNFFGERSLSLEKLLKTLKQNPCYILIYGTDYQFLFKKNPDPNITCGNME